MTYTLPNIPDNIDTALRLRARQEGRPVESLIVEILAQGVGLGSKKRDLSDIVGTITPEDRQAIDEVRDFHDRIDPEMWK